jgi:hypothetical protein
MSDSLIEKTAKATQAMREKVMAACETMRGRMEDPCVTIPAQIAVADARLEERRINGYLMGDNTFLNNAIYVNPYSEEYCFQTLALRRFSPELQQILKFRSNGHEHLCPGRMLDSALKPTKLVTTETLLKKLSWFVDPHNAAHPVHAIYAELEKLLTLQQNSKQPVSIITAGEELLRTAAENKALVQIVCDPTRLAYTQELMAVNIPALTALQITGRTRQAQARMLVDILTLKKPLSDLISTNTDKSFDTLTQTEINEVIKLRDIEKVDINIILNLITEDKEKLQANIDSYQIISEKLDSCVAANASSIMTSVNQILTQAASSALALSVATSALECTKHAEKFIAAPMQFGHAENSSSSATLDSGTLLAICTVSLGATLAVCCVMNAKNAFAPLKKFARNLFWGKKTENNVANQTSEQVNEETRLTISV